MKGVWDSDKETIAKCIFCHTETPVLKEVTSHDIFDKDFPVKGKLNERLKC